MEWQWSRGEAVGKTSITGDEFEEYQRRSVHQMGCLVEYGERWSGLSPVRSRSSYKGGT
jgi:hypothetical protein